jgi:hydrogenase nickel incorporation protein HypA/HybF
MHERSLARGLLRQVQAVADDHYPCCVRSIRVHIGEFSGVEAELLASAFAALAEETPLRHAELVVERTPLQAACRRCRGEFHVQKFVFRCPTCGSPDLTVFGGEELLLDSITMEEPANV